LQIFVVFDFAVLMSIFIYLVYLGQAINNAALEHRFILLKKQVSQQTSADFLVLVGAARLMPPACSLSCRTRCKC
jgi:hypothetical protein